MHRLAPLLAVLLITGVMASSTGCQSRKKKKAAEPQVRSLRTTWGDSSDKRFDKWKDWENDQAEKWFDRVMD